MNDNPTPKIINWVGYLAITLLLTLPLAVLMVRAGIWQQGLLLYALGCLGAALLLALSLIMLLFPRFAPWRRAIASRAVCTLPGTLLLLQLLAGGRDHPQIHDITTDPADPPLFTMAVQQRGAGANTLDIVEDTLAQQREAYPDLGTLVTTVPVEAAFERAVRVAGEMGWEVYHQDLNAGVIEAVDTTAIMGFKDDIVIRLRTNAQGTLLDLRSVSRVGESDLGANAARIRAFQQYYNSSNAMP